RLGAPLPGPPAVPLPGPPPAPWRRRSAEAWTLGRFVLAGAAGNGAHAVVFLVLGAATALPAAVGNVLATVVSTLVANELHRRFTFRAAGSGAWATGHGIGGAAAVAGLVLSTLALTGWHSLVPGASDLSGLVVVHVVTALVGTTNFLLLRVALRAPART
ncbi:GtrA family protein, partial [Kineococcus sp. T13]|uniref:GtrA family protein n=1 Tax=Kineococcus vitellinus TaxID=2696565 RepID=UPI00141338CC